MQRDPELAMRWYYRAAEQNHAGAQFNLGHMHEHGSGIPKHLKEALRWYDKAARQGAADAQANLGLMYLQGKGVKTDRVMAYAWLSAAAEQKIANARNNKDFVYGKLNLLEKKQAEKLAQEFIKKYIQ